MNMEEILGKIDNLPPMPTVAVHLLEAANNPEIDMATVAEWIGRDPGMTANLLRLCNSCFYGFAGEVSSVRQAASLFGLRKLAQIALTALSSRYLTSAHPGYELASGELWKHSIIAATAAETVASQCGYDNVGTAFTAGLLHDIGKIVIAEYVGQERNRILELAHDKKMGFMAAERQVLGFTHCDIGAVLLSRWNFPAPLCEAVRCHHDSQSATLDPKLARITQLADALTMIMGIGLGADGLCYPLPESVLQGLGITSQDTCEGFIAIITKRIADAPDLFTTPKQS
jgi:putative nucleotidyltransferase with HDIG domain